MSFFSALIKKIFIAKIQNKKSISLLGTGRAKRELIFVDDIADAVLYFMKKNQGKLNKYWYSELTIKQYAEFIMKRLGLKFQIKFDKNIQMGLKKSSGYFFGKKVWLKAKTSLNDGFNKTYKEFIEKKLYL